MKLSDAVDFAIDPNAFDIFLNDSARPLTFLNEAGNVSENSKFFLAGHEFGPTALIHVESYRGDGFETAYEAWIDSMPTIEDSEMIEAYSPTRDRGSFLDEAIDAYRVCGEGGWTDEDWTRIRANARAAFDAMIADAHETGDYPEIVEGYRENSSGGVVSVGHYECFHEADLDQLTVRRKAETPSD